jgi:hypothetical protein
LQFVNDLKGVLDHADSKLIIISDLRHGVIKDVIAIDKLAKLTQHPQFSNATAFGSVTSAVYTGVYERLARKKGHDEETWPTFEKAIHYLEEAEPGVTQGIDWAAVLK